MFAPLAFAVAAQIEAIDVGRMTLEGTRLRRNVLELQRVLGTDAVFCASPSAMEIEALGASVDCGTWPSRPVGSIPDSPDETAIDPRRLAASPRVAASLDAARQLASETSEPVIVAAFTGPATLVGELRGAGSALDEDEIWDFAGRLLAAFGRLYAGAGVNVLQWHERSLPEPSSEDLWKAALGTIGNVARFHRVPPLLVVEATSSRLAGAGAAPPDVAATPRPGLARSRACVGARSRSVAAVAGGRQRRAVDHDNLGDRTNAR